MRIAISTLPLSSEHKDRGIGTYTSELIEALKTHASGHQFSFFTKVTEIPKNADVVHYPFFDPFFLTLPVFRDKPTVVTVHDLIPVLFPEHFPRGIRGEVKWQVQRRNVSNVSHIITDSENSKKDIMRLIGFDPDRVIVVPLAPPVSMTPTRDPHKLAATMERYDLPHFFVMYVGDVNWNKNILGLLSAWHRVAVRRALSSDAKLVLVGKAIANMGLAEAQEIDAYIKKLRIEDSVMRTGYVSDDDLRALYTLARACVFPSLYEGFGLPVLEAMAAGGIVVSSDVSSLSEVVGPAFIVDPNDPKDIAQGIIRACALPVQKREEMVDKGVAWSKNFTWAKVARQTIAVYEKLGKKP